MSVVATGSDRWITSLAHFRIYAGKIKLVTKRGVYYTNRSLVMVKGSDRSKFLIFLNFVRIYSLSTRWPKKSAKFDNKRSGGILD